MIAAPTIQDNLARVAQRIRDAALRAGRSPQDVTLVAVSKTHTADEVARVLRSGIRAIGENRVQEAADKIPAVASLLGPSDPRPMWHLVGHLQTNKARSAASLFGIVESVDSLRVAEALGRARSNAGPLPILLEVSFSDDPERPGFRPDDLLANAPRLLAVGGIEVHGLMTVAPLGLDREGVRTAFRQLRLLNVRLAAQFGTEHFGQLSMGMSDDFEIGIEEGATIVRIGTAIFGPRPTSSQ